MTDRTRRLGGAALGLYLGASVVVAVVAAAVAFDRIAARRASAPETGPAVAEIVPAAAPIPWEADVFRTHAGVLTLPPASPRERDAHPRTLARFQLLRAYPGAPPRIPHGFTGDEFRTGTCNTCHERGGFSPRFGAYAPVTPHPDMPACLQCHVGRDEVTGVSLPDLDPNTVCRQCHAPGATARWMEASVDWRPLAWTTPAPRSALAGAPSIPHELFFRGNCLACHSGPAAVAEIRTAHPEWGNCRQCHAAPEPGVAEYVRVPAPAPDAEEGR